MTGHCRLFQLLFWCVRVWVYVGVKNVAFLCICFWWETATPPSQILVGHWLTVALGDDSAGSDWQQILTHFDSVLVQSDWSISNITYSEIPGEKLGGKVLWYQFICCKMSRKGWCCFFWVRQLPISCLFGEAAKRNARKTAEPLLVAGGSGCGCCREIQSLNKLWMCSGGKYLLNVMILSREITLRLFPVGEKFQRRMENSWSINDSKVIII